MLIKIIFWLYVYCRGIFHIQTDHEIYWKAGFAELGSVAQAFRGTWGKLKGTCMEAWKALEGPRFQMHRSGTMPPSKGKQEKIIYYYKSTTYNGTSPLRSALRGCVKQSSRSHRAPLHWTLSTMFDRPLISSEICLRCCVLAYPFSKSRCCARGVKFLPTFFNYTDSKDNFVTHQIWSASNTHGIVIVLE